MEMGSSGSAAEQSPEEVYRLVAAAVVQHRPIAARYDGTRRLLCPHVVGYNQLGDWRVFCYQHGGETKSGPRAAMRGLALPFDDQALKRGMVGWSLADRAPRSSALRRARRGRRRRLSWRRSAERAMR